MKVIIAGGRNFNNYYELRAYCDYIFRDQKDVEIVCGMANGTDLLGKRYGEERGYKITEFPADWNRYGKKAGYLRNEDMAYYADSLIAFWDGESKGTKHMIDIAEEHNLNIRVKYYRRP